MKVQLTLGKYLLPCLTKISIIALAQLHTCESQIGKMESVETKLNCLGAVVVKRHANCI